MISADIAPSHDILVERRCLGQTELKVRPGQVGTSNATKPNNLGTLDYAHLRVPLPPSLEGTGIFSKFKNGKWPESYFLMRRSNDGYVSATGMFKASFPRASQEEEAAEKEYIKSLKSASQEEVAGNIWVEPIAAVELAKDYGIELWIAALLSPEPILHGTNEIKAIKSPPPYFAKEDLAALGRTPEKKAAGEAGRRSLRGTRSLRSVSPTKTPSRKIATPRRPRRGRGALASVDETASLASTSELQENGDVDHHQESVKVQVETELIPSADGAEEIETTKVNIVMPAGVPELDLPQDPQEMIEQARRMVQEARKVDGATPSKKGKRKAQDMVEEDDEVGLDGPSERAPKRVRATQLELRKERIRKRAMIGTAATVAIGALMPYILGAFGAS
ncbi:hypothetical protein K431DRAFT_242192 [Polychaeton citri CBS 116435]|uniref:HTH APSES-type domain-containing protein n=1 Tax=Polychaeton citri CBS 116435 TaxID=1314669 RepID=A0A9P4QCX9_9PEZI|nr:hypothetical protein K431DRAFT_242192 [Polychaeton citri CBS 116435]